MKDIFDKMLDKYLYTTTTTNINNIVKNDLSFDLLINIIFRAKPELVY